MTVEERARACAAEMGAGDIWERAVEAIEKHLRDQIEDCAKIANRYEDEEAEAAKMFGRNQQPVPQATHAVMSVICGRVKNEIRALAAPKEEAPDGPDDRFDLGGFECNEKQEH